MGKFLATWGAIIAFVIVAFGAAMNFERQVDQRTRAELAMCERIKQDRVDTARALTQLEKYITTMSKLNPNIKETDVVDRTQVLIAESANQLRSRILLCEPLITEGKSILDERLWREAQGDL